MKFSCRAMIGYVGYLQVIEDSNTKEFVLKDEDLIVKDK